MKTGYWLIGLVLSSFSVNAQDIQLRLSKAVQQLQNDAQMKHGIVGLSVVNTRSGEKVFEVNAQTGLAPASCQKTITSATALELLGAGYRYQTILGYNGTIRQGQLQGDLYVIGGGDPSTGSWRYDSTNEDQQMISLVQLLQKAGISKVRGKLIGYTGYRETETLPGGWIWDDIGNYYGAGIAALNWHENQYDLVMRSGNQVGDPVSLVAMRPEPYAVTLESRLRTAAKGSGDNAFIYLPPNAVKGYVQGTIPVDETAFVISGSFPDPAAQFLYTFQKQLQKAGIEVQSFETKAALPSSYSLLGKINSPRLDSLNHWFLRKSINLYGEAFLKTLGYEKTGQGSTDSGLAVIKRFWQERGIEKSALHMIDGSGLSPQNRVTADALVKVLQYARTRPWYPVYYEALPTFNNMKLKSGTVGGAKSFAGYNIAKDGTSYTVAIIVNNYDGSAGEIVKKMYRVLDELK